jgi:ketosteroid isomerase-like protein
MRYVPGVLALACAACAVDPPYRADAMYAPVTLAAAETAFAAQSLREDMRAAFLANFDSDGVYVRNGWVNAGADLAARPAPPIVLDWRPVYAEAAASGEMGLSTGPWMITSKTAPDTPPAYGQFVSVWRRASGRPWKVAVDLGIGHAQPELLGVALEVRIASGVSARGPEGIEGAERRFGDAARTAGARSAYARHGSARLRFYRDGASPAVGKADAMASPAMGDASFVWTIERSETARSNDFGYARGRYAAAAAPGTPLGYYLRVWRVEDGEWRIALDVTNPVPRP